MSHYEGQIRARAGARFAILASRWNPRIVDALVAAARTTLQDHGVAAEAVGVNRVPGAWCAVNPAITTCWPMAVPKAGCRWRCSTGCRG